MPCRIFPEGRGSSHLSNPQFSIPNSQPRENIESARFPRMRIENRLDLVWLLCVVWLILGGCTQQMADQPRYDPLRASTFFPNGSSARPLPAGVIPHDYVTKEELLDTGMLNGKAAVKFPFSVDGSLMLRGRERYNIYCSPCHDYLGTGMGIAARRGFKRMPPSFQTDGLRSAPAGHFFDVMTNGFGAMPSYANQIPVRDRWAITAYIRALQLSQSATINDVPAGERQRLGEEKQK
jgi:mono/diheme cytochrome c family protein